MAVNNRLMAQALVAKLANLKCAFSFLLNSCFLEVAAQLGTMCPSVLCIQVRPRDTSSHQWNVNRNNIWHLVVKVVKK